jgi:hypothetical protein
VQVWLFRWQLVARHRIVWCTTAANSCNALIQIMWAWLGKRSNAIELQTPQFWNRSIATLVMTRMRRRAMQGTPYLIWRLFTSPDGFLVESCWPSFYRILLKRPSRKGNRPLGRQVFILNNVNFKTPGPHLKWVQLVNTHVKEGKMA